MRLILCFDLLTHLKLTRIANSCSGSIGRAEAESARGVGGLAIILVLALYHFAINKNNFISDDKPSLGQILFNYLTYKTSLDHSAQKSVKADHKSYSNSSVLIRYSGVYAQN